MPNLLQTGQSVNVHGVLGVTVTAFLTSAELLGRETVRRMLVGEEGYPANLAGTPLAP